MKWNQSVPGRFVRAWAMTGAFALLTFAAGAQAAPSSPAKAGFARGGHAGPPTASFAHAGQGSSQQRPGGGLRKDPDIQVDPDLLRQLGNGNRQTFAIEFEERPDLSAARSMDWEARGQYVYRTLKQAAERSQARVIEHLERRGADFHSYFIKNAILVENGDLQTLQGVLTFSEVKRVRIPPKMELIVPPEIAAGSTRKSENRAGAKVVGSNIAWINADDVWAMGIHGTGVVVGSIDSGVRYDHEALVNQYRGNLGGGSFNHNFNWYDPELGTAFPAPASTAIDDQHGTHTTGTMVGDDRDPVAANRDQVGVAPDAKWIACQGFPASGSVDAALLACGEFMLAPHDLSGNNANPNLRPNAVNNSWGSCPEDGALDDFYDEVVENWNAAGIIPVFSNGNASNCGYPEPPGLATVGSPGNSPFVFGVGSTGNSNGLYAEHSNWGPTQGFNPGLPDFPDNGGYPQLKPNVVSPGENIRSTIGTSTTSYDAAGWSGTSMSAPHVTGLIALMYEAAPCLIGDFGMTGTIIQNSARGIDYASGGLPGVAGPGPGNIPNFATGWGEIDALEAVNQAIEACGPQGIIAGTVTAQSGGAPIAGAQVEIFVDENVRIYSTTTDAAGHYTRTVPVPDPVATYSVRITRYGFVTQTVAGVGVTEDQTTTVDAALEAADFFTVNGTVTDAVTGWPLHARIDIAGYPDSPVWSDPVTGEYSVQLAEAIDYTLNAQASVDGYANASQTLPALAAGQAVDFALAPDLGTCLAPGYGFQTQSTTDFESGLPPGWTRSSLATAPLGGWRFGNALGSASFVIPPHTNYAASNDDACGNTPATCNSSEDYLDTPVLDFSAAAAPSLRFASFFKATGLFGQIARVQASIDGGATWPITIGSPTNNSNTAWVTQSMNLAAVAGQANVKLRFHANDSLQWASGWAVDDVQIVLGCVAPASGGLVTGRVGDENTGAGLNGAIVEVDGGETVESFHVDDPAFGDGFYAAYAPVGTHAVDAAPGDEQPDGYGTDSASATIVDEENVALDLALPAGRLTLDPSSLSTTLQLGQVGNDSFEVDNGGGLPASYSLVADQLGADFETGVPPAGWTATDEGSGCPWLPNTDYGLPNYAGGDGISATVNSDACGDGTLADARLTSPRINLASATAASLQFVLSFRALGSSALIVEVSGDGGQNWAEEFVQTVASASATGPGTPVVVSLTDYIGHADVRVRFRYVSEWDWWAQVDQVRILSDANATPWLGVAPTFGALAPATSKDHDVFFRANQVAQPGAYATTLRVLEDTPYDSPTLAASMTVTAPPNFGTLNGTVTGLGYCDEDPAPVAGATILIQGQSAVYQTTTDEDGHYVWQLDAGQSPLTVTAVASGHVSASSSGVAVTAGGSATADFDLRLQEACFDVVEEDVSAMLQSGDTTTRPLTLANTGAGSLGNFSITAGGDVDQVLDVVLTQSVADTILVPNTVACPSGDNGFYRLFDTAEEGFVGDVTLESLRFGVESAEAASGTSQIVEIGFYAISGPLDDFDNYTQLADFQQVEIEDGDEFYVDVDLDTPITVPAGTRLLVEVYSFNGNAFYPASNDEGETAPSYIYGPNCGATFPTPFAELGFPEVQLVFELGVSGSAPCSASATPATWLSAMPASGGIAAGQNAEITARFDATGQAVGSYGGSLCVVSSDIGAPLTIVPATMNVVAQVPDIDLSVAVTDAPDPVQAGTPLAYAVTVANAGPSAASGVTLDVELGATVAYDGFAGAGWNCTENAGEVSCSLAGALASGANAPLSITVTPLASGTLAAGFSVDAAEEDIATGNNTLVVNTTVTPAPNVDLAINASLDPASVLAGAPVRLRVVVANVGTDAASGVEVAVALPAGVGYASATGTGWSCVAGATDVVCTLTGIVAQGFAPNLELTLSTSTAGAFDLEAAVSSTQADGNAANNAATVQLIVTPATIRIFGGPGGGGGGFED